MVGICSFFKNNSAQIPYENQYQLRGMAVLQKFQGKGIGNIILNYGEKLLKNMSIDIVWCNAREAAVNFYKKNGYQIIGDAFNIKDIGIHHAMFKKLDS
ncbi:GNAT family N-acetyltransferase [Sabulilitoribacter multivorans]|uniref:GNAT family N-acetyltransferase n=1 Tax=Flaviramulus multivorans TaxID=1304750 RepID=A0ABS9IIG2_9FLAO|nr:GNAT family N-acetyltransferase [Flaviramulus multivorans]